jgi:hypothetical protein
LTYRKSRSKNNPGTSAEIKLVLSKFKAPGMKLHKSKLAYAKVCISQTAFTDSSISLEKIRVNETYVIAEMTVFIIFIQNQRCKNYDLV